MSEIRSGWLARDRDGTLFYFEYEPQWDDHVGQWDHPESKHWKRLPSDEYAELIRPGECIQVMQAHELGRAGALFEAEAHRKTLDELAALRARLEEAERENAYLQSELAEAYDIINGLAGWIEQQYVEQGRSQSEIDDLMDREWNFLDKHEDEIERFLEEGR